MADDLVTFLRARYDEEEQAARAAKPGPWTADGGSVYATHPTDEVVDYTDSADHIARHDPARVLAEVDAKRRIIRQAFVHAAAIDGEWGCSHDAEAIEAGACEDTEINSLPLLRLLALPYADHEEFKEEWRP